jgi:pyridoxine 5-phosphate synthase
MANLCVNIDHVATLRQARGGKEPDTIAAAIAVEQAGAAGITVHLREDRRHIQDRDVELLRQVVQTKLNLEMAATTELMAIACRLRPDECTLVPEKRQELTTEGGLDVAGQEELFRMVCSRLHDAKITVSLFVDPDIRQIEMASAVGADVVELHTGSYARAHGELMHESEFAKLLSAAEAAQSRGLRINAGHGLNYRNVRPVAELPGVEDLNIGHAIISRAVFVGLDIAVREMLTLVES